MRKKLAKLTIFAMKIAFGVLDTIAPNVQNSIEAKNYCPVEKKQHYQIDYVRLISSFIVFVILVLNFFGYTDLAKQIEHIINTLFVKLRG